MSPFANISAEQSQDPGSTLREWSSLIGIVTAIVGNLLISFALNIQRYAHIRLGKEEENEKKQTNGLHKSGGQRDYGTQQGVLAEERARLNAKAPQEDGDLHAVKGDSSKYVQPTKTSEGIIHARSSSDSTIKPTEKGAPAVQRKTYLRSPYWWGGIILMTVGEAGNFLAYGFAPASIVSPLGVVALISNCIIAPCLLKERFRQRDFWGVMIAIAGAVIIVSSAKMSENRMGPDDVWAAITRWEFETYLGVTAALILVLMWASEKYGRKTILIDLGLVGLFGGYTALSTKGVASLLSDTLWRALTFPITYLLVLILVVTALMQIRYVNRALQRFDSTQVIPIQFVLFTISVIIGSAILYRDFESTAAGRMLQFSGGCLLTFLGVYMITSGRAREEPHDECEHALDDEENAIGLIDEEAHQDTRSPASNHRKSSASTAVRFNAQTPTLATRRTSMQPASLPSTPPPPSRTPSVTSSTLSTAVQPPSPWKSADELPNTSRPPAIEASISSPLLPSEATRSAGPSTPSTPSTPRPSNLTRRSMARLTPGPLMSPLSAPLSAVVADERRRTLPRNRSVGRPRLAKLRNGKGRTTDEGSPLKMDDSVDEQAVDDEEAVEERRSQSFGGRLSGYFRRGSKGKGRGSESASEA